MHQGFGFTVPVSPGRAQQLTLKKAMATVQRWGFPGGARGKESICQCRRLRKREFDLWIGKIPWRRKWQPTPVFLPGKSMDRGAWLATVHAVTKSWTWLSMSINYKQPRVAASVKREISPLFHLLWFSYCGPLHRFLFVCFFFFVIVLFVFCPHCTIWGILAPWSGIGEQPMLPAVKGQSANHWTTRKSPSHI